MPAELLLVGRLLASLAVALALAVVTIRFVLPRLGGIGSRRNPRIQVLEVRSIDRQHKVALLETEGERFLVGLSAGGSTSLLRNWSVDATPAGPRLVVEEVGGHGGIGGLGE